MNDHRSDKWSAANIYGNWSGLPVCLFFVLDGAKRWGLWSESDRIFLLG